MSVTAKEIDKIRRLCGVSVLTQLVDTPFERLCVADIAAVAGLDEAIVKRLFSDIAGMVEQGLSDRDDALLLRLGDDFAEAADASIHDKVLEGLVARYEDYNPIKGAIGNLNKAAVRLPKLGLMLVMSLNDASERLLGLVGVQTHGMAGMLRVKSLSAIVLSCQRQWFNDDSADLAATTRMLDNRLQQAAAIGQNLGLIERKARAEQAPKETKEET